MMRFIIPAILFSMWVPAAAEDMIGVKHGVMCTSEKAVADLSLPRGGARKFDASNQEAVLAQCQDVMGERVTVIKKRRNTSIVTPPDAPKKTFYVANIDFAAMPANCFVDNAKVTLSGTLAEGSSTDEDARTGGMRTQHFPLVKLDTPICFAGVSQSVTAGKEVGLVPKEDDVKRVAQLMGRRVTVSGSLSNPDTGDQPETPILMFDPAITAKP